MNYWRRYLIKVKNMGTVCQALSAGATAFLKATVYIGEAISFQLLFN
jgi:hypothetical protein